MGYFVVALVKLTVQQVAIAVELVVPVKEIREIGLADELHGAARHVVGYLVVAEVLGCGGAHG